MNELYKIGAKYLIDKYPFTELYKPGVLTCTRLVIINLSDPLEHGASPGLLKHGPRIRIHN